MSALLSSTFNAASNRTRLAATVGDSADFVTEFSYDNLQRMTGIQQHGVSGGNAVADKRSDLAYNAAGQFSAISRYADIAGIQAVATSDFVYDGTGRLVALTHAQGTNTLADYSWSFDAGNRLTQFTSLHDGIADYSYDDRGQLTGSQYDYQGDESYSYDANGNRTNTGYNTGPNNQPLSDGTYNYQYDAEGNRIKKTEIASGEATEYHWDHRNRLVSVVHLDALGVPIQTVDYVYDTFDRRIGKSDTPAGGPTEVEVYVYDGAHVALRFIDGQLANRYLHGPAIDQILADEQVDSLSSPGEILWPLTDHLGTVRDLAAYDDTTDTTSVANHLAYDAFGRVTAQSNAAVDHLFGYTGREWDSAVDLQYNRARWYDPAIGRWLSEDPIGFAAGDPNLSRYVGNRATVSTDPSGLQACGIFQWLQELLFGTNSDNLTTATEGVATALTAGDDARNAFANGATGLTPSQQLDYAVESLNSGVGGASLQQGVAGLTDGVREVYIAGVNGTAAMAGMGDLGPRRLPVNPQNAGVPIRPRNPASAPVTINTRPGTYVFAQDANGVIFVVPDGPGLHPTVLGNGQGSAAAGEITIGANGVITEINNISYTFTHDGSVLPGVQAALEALGFTVAPNAVKPFSH